MVNFIASRDRSVDRFPDLLMERPNPFRDILGIRFEIPAVTDLLGVRIAMEGDPVEYDRISRRGGMIDSGHASSVIPAAKVSSGTNCLPATQTG